MGVGERARVSILRETIGIGGEGVRGRCRNLVGGNSLESMRVTL